MSQKAASRSSASASSSRAANGKRSKGEEVTTASLPEKKRARTEKSQPLFRPLKQGQDETTEFDVPPPPPSERKIGRRRASTHAKLAKMAASPAPTREGRELATGYDSEEEVAGTRANSLFTPKAPKAVPHLSFKPITRPRPSAAPPPSPGPMGPPPTVPRRARKSRLGEAIFDSEVPIPITDTPVINRNRELRKDAERRSSLGMRGQRGSSSFGRGEPSYPHSGIPSSQFYKHIPLDQPEPIKARWLISWCAKRAMDEHLGNSKGKQRAKEPDEVDKLLSDIIDDFVGAIAKGSVDTNVFGAPGATTSTISVRPHPKNVENRATLAKEEAIIKRMRQEDRDWNRIAAKTNDLQAKTLADTNPLHPAPPPDLTQTTGWFKDVLRLADNAVAASTDNVGSAADFGQVEFEVDMLHQTSHQAHEYVRQTKRFLDGIFSSLAADLRARDGQTDSLPPLDSDDPDTAALLAAAAAGPSRGHSDPMSMLRSLAMADSKQQSSEAIAKAAAVSVAPATSKVAATPRRTAPGTTPRRASVYGKATNTPRR